MIGHPMVTSIIMIMERNVQHFFGRYKNISIYVLGWHGWWKYTLWCVEKNIFLRQGRLAIYMI